MRTYPAKKLFTVEEYYRMAEAGILSPRDRVELIRGEIIEMSPIGRRHAAAVDRATDLFTAFLRGRANVRVQNPVRMDDYNEPQPDISLLHLRSDYYASGHPTPGSTYLVLEVSDASLQYDRETKLAVYAISGIPEVWIENLRDDVLLVYRDPSSDSYRTSLSLRRGDTVSPLAFPDLTFAVSDILG
jgi:Uma2 family endonuclease